MTARSNDGGGRATRRLSRSFRHASPVRPGNGNVLAVRAQPGKPCARAAKSGAELDGLWVRLSRVVASLMDALSARWHKPGDTRTMEQYFKDFAARSEKKVMCQDLEELLLGLSGTSFKAGVGQGYFEDIVRAPLGSLRDIGLLRSLRKETESLLLDVKAAGVAAYAQSHQIFHIGTLLLSVVAKQEAALMNDMDDEITQAETSYGNHLAVGKTHLHSILSGMSLPEDAGVRDMQTLARQIREMFETIEYVCRERESMWTVRSKAGKRSDGGVPGNDVTDIPRELLDVFCEFKGLDRQWAMCLPIARKLLEDTRQARQGLPAADSTDDTLRMLGRFVAMMTAFPGSAAADSEPASETQRALRVAMANYLGLVVDDEGSVDVNATETIQGKMCEWFRGTLEKEKERRNSKNENKDRTVAKPPIFWGLGSEALKKGDVFVDKAGSADAVLANIAADAEGDPTLPLHEIPCQFYLDSIARPGMAHFVQASNGSWAAMPRDVEDRDERNACVNAFLVNTKAICPDWSALILPFSHGGELAFSFAAQVNSGFFLPTGAGEKWALSTRQQHNKDMLFAADVRYGEVSSVRYTPDLDQGIVRDIEIVELDPGRSWAIYRQSSIISKVGDTINVRQFLPFAMSTRFEKKTLDA